MSKYFPTTARHANSYEFLELKQGTMAMMEYVVNFTELACFVDDYVATKMAKVRSFEDGLKFPIRGKIVGFLLQDVDSMVRTAMAIEKEIEDTGASGMRVLMARGRRVSLLQVREISQRLQVREGFRVVAIRAKVKPGLSVKQDRQFVISTINLDI